VLLVLVLLVFGAPLFIGLGRTDLDNDEALYSYSVERMIALHDWMTPRGIYDGADNPNLEKPPLKIWIVAAGQLAGLPGNEFGLRFFDPCFAIAAFAYVFALGRRLAGPLCGVVALLVLFTFAPLVFEHGIRTNNMEAALLLTYCGGVYHFLCWTEDRGARRHAWATSAYFAFGFLTKFVAALFLPAILLTAFVWKRDAIADVRSRAREWIWPVVGAIVIIAPWFLYHSAIRGLAFWQEILGHQIVTRFTSGLDPNHLRPWNYYFVQAWDAFRDAGAAVAAVAGIACLAWRAWQGRPWLARLIFVWWILPFVFISAGSSKLIHYSYPFLPPVALGVGLAATIWIDIWTAGIARWQTNGQWFPLVTRHRPLEFVLTTVAAVLFAFACWTAIAGPLEWKVLGVRVLRNTSVLRPAVVGAIAIIAAGSTRAAVRAVTTALLLVALPVPAYFAELQRLAETYRPLHAIRDCALAQASGAGRADGVLGPDWRTGGHSFFYYFRSLGPYRFIEGRDDELARRLFDPKEETPVILPKTSAWNNAGSLVSTSWESLAAVDLVNYVAALPGPYAACAVSATQAGAPPFQFAARR
jgi:4-amino-4-deoxy-L-arabinose transferase-like glycosyltransferase